MYRVLLTRFAQKRVARLPLYVKEALTIWIGTVELLGLPIIRKVKGYHDEPLRGNRTGQRSIRLNRSYRAIYIESDDGDVVIITILEVSKHDY